MQEVDEDADAVAAHFRERAVTVAVVHEPFGLRVRGQQLPAFGEQPGGDGADEPVAADAAVPVAEGGDLLRGDGKGAVGVSDQDEVVAGSVALGELQAAEGRQSRRRGGQRRWPGFRPCSKVTGQASAAAEPCRPRCEAARPGPGAYRQSATAFAGRSGSLPVEPADPGVGAEPGELAAGELPGRDDGLFGGLRLVRVAVHDLEELGVAEGTRRGLAPPQARGVQRRTSARSPCSTIAWTRAARRVAQLRSVHVQADLHGRLEVLPGPGMNELKGRPVSSKTSRARMTRRASPSRAGGDRDPRLPAGPAAGRGPASCSSASSRRAEGGVGAREVEHVEGGADVEAGAAGEDGPFAAAVDVRDHGAAACCWKSETLASSVTSRMSRRWCGTPLRSASVILAVPMSMPR